MPLTAAARKTLAIRLAVLTVISVVTAALSLSTASTATAAGSGVLNLQLTPVNLANGSTITDAANGTNNNQITYRVQYSCTTAACDNTQVRMSPAPPDPHRLLPDGEWILKYSTWVPPVGGGTISGTDVTGKVIDLGNLAAGTSGTFTVTYAYQASTGREVPNGSFYPDGFPIAMSATATSATAVDPVSANASTVTWHIGTPTGPSSSVSPGNGTFATDVPVTYQLGVNAGNIIAPGSCLSGNADVVAAGSYRIVYTFPAQAEIQSASNGGVVDNATHTVTWTSGTPAAPSYGARGGFGLAGTAGFNCGGPGINNTLRPETDDDAFFGPRSVVVTYPGANFPEADASGCNFTAKLTSTVAVDVSYLDGATTQRSSTQSVPSTVACTSPFGGLAVDKRIANGAAGQFQQGDNSLGGNPELFALNVTPPGETDPASREWRVQAINRGNVDATAVIDEPNLVQDHLKVYRIYAYQYAGAPAGWRASVDWVDNTGASGTATLADQAFVEAQPGRWFVSAHTTAPIAAGRVLPGDSAQTIVQMGYRFHIDDTATVGDQITNTAPVTLVYPDDADGDGVPDDYKDLQGQPLPTRSLELDAVRTARYTQPAPNLVAMFTADPVVAGGGKPKVGTEVTYAMRARTDNVWPGTRLRPQLVFVAPEGWNIVPGSATFTANGQGETTTAPVGVTFDYATKTIGGVSRQVVVATWPTSVAPSPTVNEVWPTLSVRATPTTAATPGTSVLAQVWAGDASGTWSTATNTSYLTRPTDFRAFNAPVTDAPDVDGDGRLTEDFATANSTGVIVAATDGIRVVKELCVPDTGASDGCNWVSDPAQLAGVPVDATDVTYRITVQNSGNTTLHHVVAYDVLPYPGDTGLLAGSAPRGSQFSMRVSSLQTASPGVTVAYSASTNPARPEVYPGAPGTVDDWGADPTGKAAIRVTVDADLPANTSKQVVFRASVAPGAQADQVACNTAAVDSNETLPVEPRAVCVKLAEADLALTTGPLAPWKIGRATTIPFTVVNHGGSAGAGASVTVDVPAGIRVDGLTPAGWSCAAPGGGSAPVPGATTLTCSPVDGGGSVRTLAVEAPEHLVLAVTPTAASATPLCVVASIAGPMFDRVASNNEDDACQPVAPLVSSLTLDKSSAFAEDANNNGLADAGDVLTYTFHVENTGDVDVADVTIDDPKIPATTPASATIAAGGSQDFTADYTVTQRDVDAGGTDNTATAAGTPASGGRVTSNPDTDKVRGPDPVADVSVVKSADLTTDGGTAGKADVGDVVTYTFVVHNAGPATAQDVSVSDPLAGLSAVVPASLATLAPGADGRFTATYAVRQRDVDSGSLVNRATVHFSDPTPPGGPVPAPRSADSNAVVIEAADTAAGLSIDKSSAFATDAHGDGLADAGDVLTYTFRVENTGNVTLTGVTVEDDLPGLGAIEPGPVTLAPGQAQQFTASYTVRQSDVDAGGTFNEARATGTPPTGPAVLSDPDSDEVDSPPAAPRVSITKSARVTTDRGTPGKADVGDVITYTFVVANAGTATAHDVSVTDRHAGLSAITPRSIRTLAPGADSTFHATYVVTAGDVAAGSVRNQASAAYTPPTPRGGPVPRPAVTEPSNLVTTPTAKHGRPVVVTRVPSRDVALAVRRDGSLATTTVTDLVTVSGLEPGGTPIRGTATLYGPAAKRSPAMCSPALVVGTVTFTARNGTIRVPAVPVRSPGHYTWKVSLPGNEVNGPAGHGCGLATESFLAHRPAYRAPVISTGFSGTSADRRFAVRPTSLTAPGLGIRARVDTVGTRGGRMSVPGDVRTVGWLARSAGIGELVGTTVIAGHVSDRHDRPGAFWRLSRAHRGAVVRIRDASGRAHRYRVVSARTYSRSERLPASLFRTTGPAELVLVSCTDRVSLPAGRFHYTRNVVVTAVPVR